MRTEFLKQFYKDLDKLPKSVNNDVADAIENVEATTRTTEIKNLKKLTGYKHAYRIKIGDYRIGVYIENGIVEFARVARRKDVYRIFP